MITSTSNPKVKELVQLQKRRRLRMEKGIFIVEGIRMFQEAPAGRVEQIYVSESFYTKKKDEVDFKGLIPTVLSDTVFLKVSDTKTPQGVLCIVRQKTSDLNEMIKNDNAHILVLDGIQDPGNLGTIFRASEAAGVTGIILSNDCVDIYNPKVIRSTMGSIYRMQYSYVDDIIKVVTELKQSGIHTYAAHLEGTKSYDQEDYTGKTAFLIGNEGNGLRDEVSREADTWIRIPMAGEVESLNVAIATSVLIFEVCRQRR